MSSNECLYNSIVPVFVKTGGQYGGSMIAAGSQLGTNVTSGTTTEQGRKVDTILLELLYTTSVNGRRCLEIRLSDIVDPFFLWQSTVSEEEFFILRREQNLLVDYNHFPYKLVELLQQCISHGREERPSFTASLQITPEDNNTGRSCTAQFSISESTSFRQILHLSLRLNPVTDQALRRHLSDVVRHYKEELDGLRLQLSSNRPLDFVVPPGRIDVARQPPPPSSNTVPVYSEGYNRLVTLEERLRFLENQNQQLSSQKVLLENEVVDLKKRLGASSSNSNPLYGGFNPNPGFNANANPDSNPNPNSNPNPKPNTNSDGQEQVVSVREIQKANDIIRKLQDEVKSLRNRARSAETAVKQLEKVSKDSQNSCESLRNELSQVRNQLIEKISIVTEGKAERDRLMGEIEEQKKLVEANEKVIEWLHQQISEDSINHMLGRHGTANPPPPTTFGTTTSSTLPFSFNSVPFPKRISPESWLGGGASKGGVGVRGGKVQQLHGTSSSSTTPPDHF